MVRSSQFILARASLTEAEIAEALGFARAAVETNSEDADTLARGGCVADRNRTSWQRPGGFGPTPPA